MSFALVEMLTQLKTLKTCNFSIRFVRKVGQKTYHGFEVSLLTCKVLNARKVE